MSKIILHPCKACELNRRDNCGKNWCHTKEVNSWAVDCRSCGFINLMPWKKAIYGCPTCTSNNVSIYSTKFLKRDS